MSIVSEAFFFPLRNSSLKMFFGLAALHGLQYFMTWIPVISIASIVFLGYIYATQFKIIFTTGNGYADAPEFPEFSDIFDSILIPLLKVAGIWIFGLLPMILVAWQMDVSETVFWLLFLVGYLYIPMGLMIAAMDDYSQAFNPIIIIQSIRASGGLYLIMCGAFITWSMVTTFLEDAFTGSWLFSCFMGAYGILFTGRIIGAVYRDRLSGELLVEDLES